MNSNENELSKKAFVFDSSRRTNNAHELNAWAGGVKIALSRDCILPFHIEQRFTSNNVSQRMASMLMLS